MKVKSFYTNAMFKTYSILVILIVCLSSEGCDDDVFLPGVADREDSIIVEGELLTYKESGSVRGPGNLTVHTLNPTITGSVRLPSNISLLENRDEEASLFSNHQAGVRVTGDCCFAVYLVADKDIFISRHNSANRTNRTVVTLEPLAVESDYHFYIFKSSPVELPSDYSAVEINLEVYEPSGLITETRLTGRIQLSNDVLVIPTHVHVMLRERDELRTEYLKRNRLFTWFYEPNFTTKSSNLLDEGSWVTQTIAYDYETIYSSVNPIWKKARIQFKLASIDYIVEQNLEKEIVTYGAGRILNPIRLHRNSYENIPGIHLYVGRRPNNNPRKGQANISCTVPLTLGGRNGTNAPIIALAWNKFGFSPFEEDVTLAHEIGHILGLNHPDGNIVKCGRELAPNSRPSNLMHSEPGTTSQSLTTAQCEFATQIACEYATVLGINNSGCE